MTSDYKAFVNFLQNLTTHEHTELRTFFNKNIPRTLTRAPGRLDLMGGIGDYSGSLVLQWPLREATFAALQRTSSPKLRITSVQGSEPPRNFSMNLEAFGTCKHPISYEAAREYFSRDPKSQWASYVAGAFLVLMREKGSHLQGGANILLYSSVPEGKGVSSSAALEVASMQAIATAWELAIKPQEIATLCQRVENLVAGAPCGIMDQMTSVFGEEGKLMPLLCQPAELQEMITLPNELSIWALDSDVKHAVSGSDYSSVRTGTFMGHRIITERSSSRMHKGYLANFSPAEFEVSYRNHLPESMLGQDFIEQHQDTADTVTTVHPNQDYAVRIPTSHPIYENERVHRFIEILKSDFTPEGATQLGAMMKQAHESYSACGLGSEATDLLVQLALDEGPSIYGAKITGGGSGGSVAILAARGADQAIFKIAARYAEQTEHNPYVFSGSSPGAARFGSRSITL